MSQTPEFFQSLLQSLRGGALITVEIAQVTITLSYKDGVYFAQTSGETEEISPEEVHGYLHARIARKRRKRREQRRRR